MRILLDESVPSHLGGLLTNHHAVSVQRRGWAGIKNGRLLALAAEEFDALITADRGMEYQQNLATLPIAIVIVLANSNRLPDMAPLVPSILRALDDLQPKTLVRISR